MRIAVIAAVALLAIAAYVGPRGRAALPAPRAASVEPAPDPVRAHHDESLRRHRELKERMEGEADPARRAALEEELRTLDRQLEIEGLELKRSLAESAGDAERVREIDALLRTKR